MKAHKVFDQALQEGANHLDGIATKALGFVGTFYKFAVKMFLMDSLPFVPLRSVPAPRGSVADADDFDGSRLLRRVHGDLL